MKTAHAACTIIVTASLLAGCAQITRSQLPASTITHNGETFEIRTELGNQHNPGAYVETWYVKTAGGLYQQCASVDVGLDSTEEAKAASAAAGREACYEMYARTLDTPGSGSNEGGVSNSGDAGGHNH